MLRSIVVALDASPSSVEGEKLALALAGAHRLRVASWPAPLTPAGTQVVVARTDRAENRCLHDDVHAAVASALDREA